MKKVFILLAALAVIGTFVFAQTAASTNSDGNISGEYFDENGNVVTLTQYIDIEDKYADLHPKASTVKISLEYTPVTGEVRLYYTCMAASYEQGDAMNTAMAVYEDFAAQNGYKHYTYLGKDKTKYFKDERGIRMATYSSYVVFKK